MNAKPVVLVGIWWLGLTGAIMLAGTAPSVIDEFACLGSPPRDAGIAVRVVERVGGKEDVPVLIEYLQEKGHNVEYVGDSYQPGVRATEEAIYKCLEKLTGTKNPATSRGAARRSGRSGGTRTPGKSSTISDNAFAFPRGVT